MSIVQPQLFRRPYTGTAAAGGGTFVIDYEIPLNRGAQIVAMVTFSRAVVSSSNLASTATVFASYAARNKNGTVTGSPVMTGSTNPLNSDDNLSAIPETSDTDFINGADEPLAEWTISSPNARLTITNPGLTYDADVTVMLEVFLFGSLGEFTPLDVPNMIAWYDAHVVTEVANRISAVPDQSGNGDAGRDLLQSVAGLKPLLIASDPDYNNEPTISCDDELRWLESGTFSAPQAQPNTIYICGEAEVSSVVIVGGATFNHHQIGRGPVYAHAGILLSGPAAVTSKRVICVVFNTTASAIYIDRYNTPNATGDVGTQSIENTSMFARPGGDGAGSGRVAQAIYYAGAHDVSNRRRIMKYLGDLYGVTVLA